MESGKEKLRAFERWFGWFTAALIVNVGVFVGLSDFVDASVGAALGTKSPEKYITASYNVYPAIDYLNKLDPLPGKALFLGEMYTKTIFSDRGITVLELLSE